MSPPAPLNVHFGGNTSAALPAVNAKIEMAWGDNREVCVRSREDWFCLCVKFCNQGAAWSRRQGQVLFLAGRWATTGDHASLDMNSISRFQIKPSVNPDLVGGDGERIVCRDRHLRTRFRILGKDRQRET